MLAASTEAQVAAVAAHFPTVCEDYIRALLGLGFVRPIGFRVQIAMEECFFQAIQYILDTRGLQDVQLTVGQWIATLFELQYGQSRKSKSFLMISYRTANCHRAKPCTERPR